MIGNGGSDNNSGSNSNGGSGGNGSGGNDFVSTIMKWCICTYRIYGVKTQEKQQHLCMIQLCDFATNKKQTVDRKANSLPFGGKRLNGVRLEQVDSHKDSIKGG